MGFNRVCKINSVKLADDCVSVILPARCKQSGMMGLSFCYFGFQKSLRQR